MVQNKKNVIKYGIIFICSIIFLVVTLLFATLRVSKLNNDKSTTESTTSKITETTTNEVTTTVENETKVEETTINSDTVVSSYVLDAEEVKKYVSSLMCIYDNNSCADVKTTVPMTQNFISSYFSSDKVPYLVQTASKPYVTFDNVGVEFTETDTYSYFAICSLTYTDLSMNTTTNRYICIILFKGNSIDSIEYKRLNV